MSATVGQYQTVCLTTLEYAVKGALVSTHCPSCGLRLVIKNDSFASNRVVSVSLLLGMSLIIGYHLGSHGHGWISQLSNKVLKALGFRRDKGSPNHQNSSSSSARGRPDGQAASHQQSNSSLQKKKYSGLENGYQRQHSKGNHSSDEELLYDDEMETRMSDLTCDSAIDVNYNYTGYDSTLSEDDIDEQLMEIFNYDHLYGELYNGKSTSSTNSPMAQGRKNGGGARGEEDEGDESIRRGRFGTGTVDRIDQVLQQVDDIKRSIVEIDDELYQIAGATYANFNPNFFSLTNAIEEEYDDLLFDEQASSQQQRATSEDRNSNLSRHSSTASAAAAFSSSASDPQHLASVNSGQLTGRAKTTVAANARRQRQIDSDAQSHASLSSLDLEGSATGGLQLEWDFDFEPGSYEYYDSSASASKAAQTEFSSMEDQMGQRRGASPLREKFSSATSELPMTDEQKLKNMHDLLDEAKRLGLLNNIIEALAPSKDKYKTVQRGEEKDDKVKKGVPI